MRLVVLVWLALVVAMPAFAHRLDEYLQATRIAVFTNRVDVALELTPGVAIAPQALNGIDSNRDGQLSGEEGTNYAQRVLGDCKLRLDQQSLSLSLVEVSLPSVLEIKEGFGVIRIKATAPVASLAAGRHVINFTNAHLPGISVYLVNALMPKDPAIKVNHQTRDELQKNYRLEFSVSASPP